MADVGFGIAEEFTPMVKIAVETINMGYKGGGYTTLGEMHFQSNNFGSALQCFREAANENNQRGIMLLATLCYEGYGNSKDVSLSKQKLAPIAERGNPDAILLLGVLADKYPQRPHLKPNDGDDLNFSLA
jgi:TPR repeat protein